MQKKTIISISIVVLACALLVAACIYLFPMKSISLNATMEATKLDSDGHVIGTTQIAMQGAFKKYLIKESAIELTVAPFGELKNIAFTNSNDKFGFEPITLGEFYWYTGSAWDNSKGDMVFVTVTMSQDFEYWLFYVNDNDDPVYYVASTKEHTVEEIVQFFKGLAPGYKAP